jgi:hypothetical protein
MCSLFPCLLLGSMAMLPVAAAADESLPDPASLFITDPAEVDHELTAAKKRGKALALHPKSYVPNLDQTASTCDAVLVHAAKVYASEYSLDDQKSWAYAKKCGSSSSSSNFAVNLVIEEMPLGLSGGRAAEDKWCNENSSYATRTQGYQKIENKVMALAIQNWGQCMEAAQNNLHTRVNVSITDTVFQFKIKNGTDEIRSITAVSANSDEGSGLSCDSQRLPLQIKPNQVATFNCVRSYVDVTRGGARFQVLPGGTITFANNISPYFYSFKERFKVDAMPDPAIPPKILVSLNGAHLGTRAYWSGGRHSSLRHCPGVPINQPREGVDLVEIGSYEKRTFGRGQCATEPYCDSHNEFCREVFYTQACFVNKAWHEWYKTEMEKLGVAYSREAVCGNP